MLTVNDIRKKFLNKLDNNEFVRSHSENLGAGTRMIEVIGESFIADEPAIFGTPNMDYIEREIQWYMSRSRNVMDIPGDVPAIWRNVADPDGNINSNYGWCIFSAENGGQYWNVVDALTKDGRTRRAEMIYTRPSMHTDYNTNGMSDFMCFSGDTLVISPEKTIPIREVVDIINKDGSYPVFSMNMDTKKREIKRAIRGECTGEKEIVRVYFDNGRYIDTTEDHIFYIKKRVNDGLKYRYEMVECKAKDLMNGYSMVTSMISKNGPGHHRIKVPFSGENSFNNCKILHRMYYEWSSGEDVSDYEIHHLNEVKNDNRICNLKKISKSEHMRLHQLGSFNNVHKIKDRTEQLAKMKKTMAETVANRTIEWYEAKHGITIGEAIDDMKSFMDYRNEFNFKKYMAFCKQNKKSHYISLLYRYKLFSGMTYKQMYEENCKVLKVEYTGKTESVYDIEVEDNHTFFVGWNDDDINLSNGILVHNCTDSVSYFIRNWKVHAHVKMRSNDVVFGYKNDVAWQQFVLNMLVKDVASATQLPIENGDIIWTASSLHVYERHFHLLRNAK